MVFALLLPLSASADEQANAPTVTGETGLFTLIPGDTLPGGQWSFGLYYNNWDRVFEFDDHFDIDWNRLSASFGYGITDDFEISVMAPYEDFNSDVPGSDDSSGIGNVRVNGKYKFSGDEDSSFGINFFVELPTGDSDVLAGDTGGGVGLGWRSGNWVYDVGYRKPGIDRPSGFSDVSDEINGGIGYAGNISDNFNWITELNAIYPLDSDKAIFKEAIDLTSGGRYWFGADGNWAFNFALRTDVLQLSETDDHCPIGGLLGLTYFPRGFVGEEIREVPAPIYFGLNVEKEGNCDGLVSSTPAGIDCGADCSEDYTEGTVVNLTATPDSGCTFAGWSGDSDCSDGSVTMNGDRYCVATFNEVPPPPPPVAPKAPPEERVTVNFPSGARLTNIAKAKLDEVALKLKQDDSLRARVIGYSDSTGTDAANQRISQQRAEAVKTYLVTRHGIDPARITTEGRGAAEPVGDNSTAAGRAANRRAVVIISVQ